MSILYVLYIKSLTNVKTVKVRVSFVLSYNLWCLFPQKSFVWMLQLMFPYHLLCLLCSPKRSLSGTLLLAAREPGAQSQVLWYVGARRGLGSTLLLISPFVSARRMDVIQLGCG